MKKLLILFFIVTFCSCGKKVNTVVPQEYKNIEVNVGYKAFSSYKDILFSIRPAIGSTFVNVYIKIKNKTQEEIDISDLGYNFVNSEGEMLSPSSQFAPCCFELKSVPKGLTLSDSITYELPLGDTYSVIIDGEEIYKIKL